MAEKIFEVVAHGMLLFIPLCNKSHMFLLFGTRPCYFELWSNTVRYVTYDTNDMNAKPTKHKSKSTLPTRHWAKCIVLSCILHSNILTFHHFLRIYVTTAQVCLQLLNYVIKGELHSALHFCSGAYSGRFLPYTVKCKCNWKSFQTLNLHLFPS